MLVRTDGDDCVTGHGSTVWEDGKWRLEEETECNVAHDGLGLRSGYRGVLAGALESLQADLVSSVDSSRLGSRDWWCGRGARCSRGRCGAPRLILWDEW